MYRKLVSLIPVYGIFLVLLTPYPYTQAQGQDPDRPSGQNQHTGQLICYEEGERDGEKRIILKIKPSYEVWIKQVRTNKS